MNKITALLFALIACVFVSAAPFTALKPDEHYGVGTITWRLSSQLARDATGTIELCYQEKGGPEQVLGRVGIRPFTSSSATMPDLRILFAQTMVASTTKAVLIVGYGIRSGCFVVDAPEITSHAKLVEGMPEVDPNGEYTLLLSHKEDTVTYATRVQDSAGRLYIRYIPQNP